MLSCSSRRLQVKWDFKSRPSASFLWRMPAASPSPNQGNSLLCFEVWMGTCMFWTLTAHTSGPTSQSVAVWWATASSAPSMAGCSLGRMGAAPRSHMPKKVPEFATTKVWPSCEVNNMILVWYHCDSTSPAWQVSEQEEASSPNWAFRAGTEHFVSVHIEEIPENAADAAHLSFLHSPSVMSGNDLRFTNNHRWAFFRHTWEAEWQPEPEPNGHCSVMILTHHVLLFGKPITSLDLHVSARQVGPGLVIMALSHAFLGKGMIIQTVTPLEPLLQHVVHQIYYPRNIPSFLAKLVLWAEGVQFERDMMIWNNKRFLSKPLLVKEDAAILRHRRWFSQFYSQNSWKPKAQKGQLDW
ncbi:cholesterol 7-desaturase nvd-like isoform X6 [Crotalus tigris]|uniref:cholesterol 7-desaturase nvd-like isoform X6 n=1 Tax=Crotalus tigris TaxID=88082 RepID=UPI00192F65B7|nr:cholesterol 7-desaturase nvd-like isoform X6 [Crotalus tigris]